MNIDATDDIILARASRAESILSDPLVSEVLSAMKTAIAEQFFGTAIDDAKTRELLHHMDRARAQFESAFRSLIMGGRMAQEERSAEQQHAAAMAEIQRIVKER